MSFIHSGNTEELQELVVKCMCIKGKKTPSFHNDIIMKYPKTPSQRTQISKNSSVAKQSEKMPVGNTFWALLYPTQPKEKPSKQEPATNSTQI